MKVGVSVKYAVRSLARHLRRTILSILGVGVGTAVCLFLIAFVRGEGKMMVKAAAESGVGHLRVAPVEWARTRENACRLDQWRTILHELRQRPGIAVATPRARVEALLAFGTRTAGVEVLGVEPASEFKANRMARSLAEGRYLNAQDTDATVVGRAIAKRLDVELGDDLMITVAAEDGDMHGAMLRIVGIVETGSRDLDSTICHITLSELERITRRAGAAEITVLLATARNLESQALALRQALPGHCAVLTWTELLPELAAGVEVDKTWTRLIVSIVMLVVFLGIASAQLAAVLERRREFAVLSALGMSARRLVGVMLLEGLVLGVFGWLLGLALGLPSAYWMSVRGIDFSTLMKSRDITMSNILFDPVFKGDFGWWLAPLGCVLALAATVLSSLYPAWFAVKTDPASALRVEQ